MYVIITMFIAFIFGVSCGIFGLNWSVCNERKKVMDTALALFKDAPIPNNAVIVKGEKGKNGGGDAGDGIFWHTGFVIMPGKPGSGSLN